MTDQPTTCSCTNRLSHYEKDVLRSAESHHMWINAFATINPTDDLKMAIGEYVLARIRDEDYTIPAGYGCPELYKLTPQLIVRFNAS